MNKWDAIWPLRYSVVLSSIAALEELNGTCKLIQIIMADLLYIISLITRLLTKWINTWIWHIYLSLNYFILPVCYLFKMSAKKKIIVEKQSAKQQYKHFTNIKSSPRWFSLQSNNLDATCCQLHLQSVIWYKRHESCGNLSGLIYSVAMSDCMKYLAAKCQSESRNSESRVIISCIVT